MSQKFEISIGNQFWGVSLSCFDNPPNLCRRKRELPMREHDFEVQDYLWQASACEKQNVDRADIYSVIENRQVL